MTDHTQSIECKAATDQPQFDGHLHRRTCSCGFRGVWLKNVEDVGPCAREARELAQTAREAEALWPWGPPPGDPCLCGGEVYRERDPESNERQPRFATCQRCGADWVLF